MPVQGNSFFSFTFSVIFVVSVSGFRDASFTFFFVQKNTKGTICNNQCIRICERLIIINYIELIIIIIFRIFAKIRFIVITTVNPKKNRTFTSIDLAAWKILYEVISCDIQKLPPGLFQSAVIFIFCYSDFMISRLSLP